MRSHLRDDDGFTLIELMVSVLIIAVLLGIGIPSFLRSRNQAMNTEAQASVRGALPGLRLFILEDGDLSDIAAGVREFNPNVLEDPAGIDGLKFLAAADDSICVWKVADTGNVYGIWVPSDGALEGTYYSTGTVLPTTCPDAAGLGAAGFTPSFW